MPQELITLLDLATRTEFLVGVGVGALATIIFLLIPHERIPGWGVALVASALVAIRTLEQPVSLTIGVSVLAAGAWLLDRPGTQDEQRYNPGWVLVAAGAMVLTLNRASFPTWTLIAIPVLILAVGSALNLWSMGPHRHLLGILMVITTMGIWATVPNTELARAALGASLPLAVATLRPIGAVIKRPGAYALAGLLVVVAVDGGHVRPASVVGAWASLGMLLLFPVLVVITGRKPVLSSAQLLLVHAVLVLIASRVIGMWHQPLFAVSAVAATWSISGALLHRLHSLQGGEA